MNRYAKINGRRAYRVIAERAVGRPLRETEVVHHIDGDIGNNSTDNLVICPSQAYHMLLHRREKALIATGNANSVQCYLCKSWDAEENVTRVVQKSRNSYFFYHKACAVNNYHGNKITIEENRALRRANDWRKG